MVRKALHVGPAAPATRVRPKPALPRPGAGRWPTWLAPPGRTVVQHPPWRAGPPPGRRLGRRAHPGHRPPDPPSRPRGRRGGPDELGGLSATPCRYGSYPKGRAAISTTGSYRAHRTLSTGDVPGGELVSSALPSGRWNVSSRFASPVAKNPL